MLLADSVLPPKESAIGDAVSMGRIFTVGVKYLIFIIYLTMAPCPHGHGAIVIFLQIVLFDYRNKTHNSAVKYATGAH